MDLQELSQRTGILQRKLRYVLDHALVPGLKIEIADTEVGRPRRFNYDVGVALIMAVRLLDLGLAHAKIRRFLRGLMQLKVRNKPLFVALLDRFRDCQASGTVLEAYAHIGDVANICVNVPSLEYRSPWVAPGNPAPLARSYKPAVEVVLDLGCILREVISDR